MGVDTSTNSLIGRLADKNESSEVRCLSARALGIRGGEAATSAVLSVIDMTREADPEVRAEAMRAVATLADQGLAPTLRDAAQSDTNNRVRYAGIRALEGLGGQVAVGALVEFSISRSETEENRLTAISALARVDPSAVSPIFERLEKSPNANIRANAAIVLSRAEPDKAVPYLVEYTRGSAVYSWIQYDAITELARISNTDFLSSDESGPRMSQEQRIALATLQVQDWWSANQHRYPPPKDE